MALVGVFDSGVGGLSVLDEALRQAPGHDYMYLADSANAPYGEKSAAWVMDRSLLLCQWLIHQQCEALIVACNTATAEAIAKIRERHPLIPIIGVEPGIKPAASLSQKKQVGILATQNTLQSDKFHALMQSLVAQCDFISQAGIGLVPLIEAGKLKSPETVTLLKQYIQPMLDQGVDTLVLGCTHYPFLATLIKQLFGDQLNIIDTSQAIVKQMVRLTPEPLKGYGSIRFYSTKDASQLATITKLVMQSPLETHDVHFETVII